MKSAMPWWLEEQSEACSFCMQPYACGLECWCVRCDLAVCPLCATRVAEDAGWLCPACRDEATTPAVLGGPQEAA